MRTFIQTLRPAIVLFVLLNQAFPLYFSLLGGSYAAYKTLGLFLVLMTWFYCLAIIMVLGVELNAFLGGHRGATEAEIAAMQVLLAAPVAGATAAPATGTPASSTPGVPLPSVPDTEPRTASMNADQPHRGPQAVAH